MTSETDRLRALGARLSELAVRSMSLWLDAGLDVQGGAHGHLDRRHRPVLGRAHGPRGPSGEILGDQSLVQQARHLYAYSAFAEHHPGEQRAGRFAHALYRHLSLGFDRGDAFLGQRHRDDGVASDAVQLYAQAFAVFALATYARVFGVEEARDRALQHFEWLDRRFYDEQAGGYDQRHDGGWLQLVSAPSGAVKCANTHLHVLEAWTALLRICPDHLEVQSRTRELAELLATRLTQPVGYLHPFFDAEWRPVGAPRVSYGHDVEAAWLLLDAEDVLGGAGAEKGRASVRQAAVSLVEHTLRTGWDPAGGLFDHGIPEGTPEPARVLDRGKVWWAQAEALPGIYRVYRLTRNEALIGHLEQTLEFLTGVSWDAEFGGYFWSVDERGRPLGRGDHKGEIWKTPYHDVRACLVTAGWIAEDTAGR